VLPGGLVRFGEIRCLCFQDKNRRCRKCILPSHCYFISPLNGCTSQKMLKLKILYLFCKIFVQCLYQRIQRTFWRIWQCLDWHQVTRLWFEFLAVKNIVFGIWCRVVWYIYMYPHVGEACCLHLTADLIMKEARFPETSVTFYQTTWNIIIKHNNFRVINDETLFKICYILMACRANVVR
jgi:hypothetical protein